jgi:hypothetical protein
VGYKPPVEKPPLGGKPPGGEPHLGKPPVDKPPLGTKPPLAEPPSGKPPVAEKPTYGTKPPQGDVGYKPPVEKPPLVGKPPGGEPHLGKPPVDKPPLGTKPPLGEPPSGKPPVAEKPTYGTKPPLGEPNLGKPPADKPPVGSKPPFSNPPFSNPPFSNPVTDKPPVASKPPLSSPVLDKPPLGTKPPLGEAQPGKPPLGSKPTMGEPFLGKPPLTDKPPLGSKPSMGDSFVGKPPLADKPPLGSKPITGEAFLGKPPLAERPPAGPKPPFLDPVSDKPPTAFKPPVGDTASLKPPLGPKPTMGEAFLGKPLLPDKLPAAPKPPFLHPVSDKPPTAFKPVVNDTQSHKPTAEKPQPLLVDPLFARPAADKLKPAANFLGDTFGKTRAPQQKLSEQATFSPPSTDKNLSLGSKLPPQVRPTGAELPPFADKIPKPVQPFAARPPLDAGPSKHADKGGLPAPAGAGTAAGLVPPTTARTLPNPGPLAAQTAAPKFADKKQLLNLAPPTPAANLAKFISGDAPVDAIGGDLARPRKSLPEVKVRPTPTAQPLTHKPVDKEELPPPAPATTPKVFAAPGQPAPPKAATLPPPGPAAKDTPSEPEAAPARGSGDRSELSLSPKKISDAPRPDAEIPEKERAASTRQDAAARQPAAETAARSEAAPQPERKPDSKAPADEQKHSGEREGRGGQGGHGGQGGQGGQQGQRQQEQPTPEKDKKEDGAISAAGSLKGSRRDVPPAAGPETPTPAMTQAVARTINKILPPNLSLAGAPRINLADRVVTIQLSPGTRLDEKALAKMASDFYASTGLHLHIIVGEVYGEEGEPEAVDPAAQRTEGPEVRSGPAVGEVISPAAPGGGGSAPHSKAAQAPAPAHGVRSDGGKPQAKVEQVSSLQGKHQGPLVRFTGSPGGKAASPQAQTPGRQTSPQTRIGDDALVDDANLNQADKQNDADHEGQRRPFHCAQCGYRAAGSADMSCPVCSSEQPDLMIRVLTQYRHSGQHWMTSVDTLAATHQARELLNTETERIAELRYLPKIPGFVQVLRTTRPGE